MGKRMQGQQLGTWGSGGLGAPRCVVGLPR